MLESGIDINSVQRLMGHKHIETTMVYLHVLESRASSIPSPADSIESILNLQEMQLQADEIKFKKIDDSTVGQQNESFYRKQYGRYSSISGDSLINGTLALNHDNDIQNDNKNYVSSAQGDGIDNENYPISIPEKKENIVSQVTESKDNIECIGTTCKKESQKDIKQNNNDKNENCRQEKSKAGTSFENRSDKFSGSSNKSQPAMMIPLSIYYKPVNKY